MSAPVSHLCNQKQKLCPSFAIAKTLEKIFRIYDFTPPSYKYYLLVPESSLLLSPVYPVVLPNNAWPTRHECGPKDRDFQPMFSPAFLLVEFT
jgi:hypothetical protein